MPISFKIYRSEVYMKKILALLTLFSATAFAVPVPTTPPNACYEGCTEIQKELENEFFTEGKLPSKTPSVFSGVCHHLGMYNPDVEHHAVVLLDRVNNKWNFSTIFSFYEGYNFFGNWTLQDARREMSPYWSEYGDIFEADQTARVVVNDNEGKPVYVYWMRQNPKTKDLLFITYMGFANKAFCRLKKH